MCTYEAYLHRTHRSEIQMFRSHNAMELLCGVCTKHDSRRDCAASFPGPPDPIHQSSAHGWTIRTVALHERVLVAPFLLLVKSFDVSELFCPWRTNWMCTTSSTVNPTVDLPVPGIIRKPWETDRCCLTLSPGRCLSLAKLIAVRTRGAFIVCRPKMERSHCC